MTTEQKAKRYDEVLELAKSWYVDAQIDFKKSLETLLPELCESEDERIRKFLIKWIQDNYYNGITEIPTKTLIAWLEKQGEQKLPIEKLPEEMKTIGESLGFTTQEECDEYNQMVSNLIMSDDNKSEQKPAWNNKEKLMLNDIIEATERSNIFMEDYQRELIDWLKSLKDRVQPQPQQEWSEDDERNLQGIIDEIEANKNHAPDYDVATYDRFLSWLKSLKNRYAFKPSKEQMKALNTCIMQGEISYVGQGPELQSLYNDLKKLKG